MYLRILEHSESELPGLTEFWAVTANLQAVGDASSTYDIGVACRAVARKQATLESTQARLDLIDREIVTEYSESHEYDRLSSA